LCADRGWLPVLPGQVAPARGLCPARPWQPWPRCADRRPLWHHVSFEVGLCAGHGRGSPRPGNSRLRGSLGVTRDGDAEITAWSASEAEYIALLPRQTWTLNCASMDRIWVAEAVPPTATLTPKAERERNLVDVAFCGLKPLADRRNGGLGPLSKRGVLRRFHPRLDRRRSDVTLMRRIRLLSDSCEVWRSGYSFCLGLLLQYRYWLEVIGTY
jgi:hypothetical protein